MITPEWRPRTDAHVITSLGDQPDADCGTVQVAVGCSIRVLAQVMNIRVGIWNWKSGTRRGFSWIEGRSWGQI